MAKVYLNRQWPDGDEITIVVKVAASYPDAVAEARSAALAAYREALTISFVTDEEGSS